MKFEFRVGEEMLLLCLGMAHSHQEFRGGRLERLKHQAKAPYFIGRNN